MTEILRSFSRCFAAIAGTGGGALLPPQGLKWTGDSDWIRYDLVMTFAIPHVSWLFRKQNQEACLFTSSYILKGLDQTVQPTFRDLTVILKDTMWLTQCN